MTHNLCVERVDVKRQLLYVRGCVPGNRGDVVRVKDASRSMKWDDQELWTVRFVFLFSNAHRTN
jgi:ribosomal protein L3